MLEKFTTYLIQKKLLIKENKMENQHRLIKGYRELSKEEIDLINEIKKMGIELSELTDKLKNMDSVDKRWLAIGVTDLQKGLMALTRSVAKPDFF